MRWLNLRRLWRNHNVTDLKLGPIRETTGREVCDMLYPQPTVLEHLRDLAIDISRRAYQGKEMVDRRLFAMPEHATHHEDYGPIFVDIMGLAINLAAVLKRESLEEIRKHADVLKNGDPFGFK